MSRPRASPPVRRTRPGCAGASARAAADRRSFHGSGSRPGSSRTRRPLSTYGRTRYSEHRPSPTPAQMASISTSVSSVRYAGEGGTNWCSPKHPRPRAAARAIDQARDRHRFEFLAILGSPSRRISDGAPTIHIGNGPTMRATKRLSPIARHARRCRSVRRPPATARPTAASRARPRIPLHEIAQDRLHVTTPHARRRRDPDDAHRLVGLLVAPEQPVDGRQRRLRITGERLPERGDPDAPRRPVKQRFAEHLLQFAHRASRPAATRRGAPPPRGTWRRGGRGKDLQDVESVEHGEPSWHAHAVALFIPETGILNAPLFHFYDRRATTMPFKRGSQPIQLSPMRRFHPSLWRISS